jgi:hypothetical protein
MGREMEEEFVRRRGRLFRVARLRGKNLPDLKI